MESLIIDLKAIDRHAIAVVGGKAANLGELLRAGFPVPNGFCVTTAAYELMLARSVGSRLTDLLQALDASDPAGVASSASEIRDSFLRSDVPPPVKQSLLEAFASLEGQSSAVRSSATAEDLPEASFAGQMESFLNVRGDAALLDAVRHCWASLWSDRAIAYRAANGISNRAVSLAVIVQRMVSADVAGVLFTVNPVSGKRTEAVVEASFGLGEAVVRGMVDPDRYRVAKQGLEIVSREVGSKVVQVISQPSGGTIEADTATSISGLPSLDDDSLRSLVSLGIRIEQHFGLPQDIEWALSGGQLWILQSRPITALYPTAPTDPRGHLRVYLSLNAVQGVVEPFTPVGASVFLHFAATAFGYDEQRPIVIERGGRLFADITDLIRNPLGQLFPKFLLPQIDPNAARIVQRLMPDPRLTAAKAPALGAPRNVLRYWRTILPLVARVIRYVLWPAAARRDINEVVATEVASLRGFVLADPHSTQVAAVLGEVASRVIRKLFTRRLAPIVASGMLCMKLSERLVQHFGLDPARFLSVRQGLPHNQTTTMDLALWQIASQIATDAQSRSAFDTQTSEQLAGRYRAGSLPGQIQERMASFLNTYGHRAIREIDVGMPRWAEDPRYLFGVLRGYLDVVDKEASPDRHFARQAKAAEEAIGALVTQARAQSGGSLKACMLGFFLRRYRQLGGLRETPKFYLVWLFQAIRQMLLSVGERLVELEYLDRAEDVVYLRIEELRDAPREGASFRELVKERRTAYLREIGRLAPPRIITSDGESFYADLSHSSASGVLSGTGVSPGTCRGRARVIRDPVDARLSPGEILVAPSTDPAWTPLFLTAAGLVMEAGGMMSHGAVVAREYGIPAVVGVTGATSKITTGAWLGVDGIQGLVTVLEVENIGT